MNSAELRAILALSAISSLRIFGLFLLLPVLAIYAAEYPDSSPFTIGLALGIYGLTQAILQIPFGLMSDRIGRKRVITIGLLIFALGSVIAALSTSLEWLIIGRAIQGGGAVSAAVLALAADSTREEQRTKAMAILGAGIGMMFLLSISIATPLAGWVGVDGLFWITAAGALLAILILHFLVPNPETNLLHRDIAPVVDQIRSVLMDGQLQRLNLGIFTLHFAMTALFLAIPAELIRIGNLPLSMHWKVYLPLVLLSVITMIPLVMMTSKTHLNYPILKLGSLFVVISSFGIAVTSFGNGVFSLLLVSLWLYFVGFNLLEAMLPSLVSRVAPAASKGSATGVYNSLQFFGIFIGGSVGGLILQSYDTAGLFSLIAVVMLGWLLLCQFTPPFKLSSSRVINLGSELSTGSLSESHRASLVDKLSRVRGVQEVTILQGEQLAYLKVDDKDLDTDALFKLKST
ncbi:MAG: MFS transporter [Acidiferrobacterales bacterium]|nr:MFS transporter [Acidiferrobacterales bacterium]